MQVSKPYRKLKTSPCKFSLKKFKFFFCKIPLNRKLVAYWLCAGLLCFFSSHFAFHHDRQNGNMFISYISFRSLIGGEMVKTAEVDGDVTKLVATGKYLVATVAGLVYVYDVYTLLLLFKVKGWFI